MWTQIKPISSIILVIMTLLFAGCARSPVVTPQVLSQRAQLCVEGWECTFDPAHTPAPNTTTTKEKSTQPGKAAQQAILSKVEGQVTLTENSSPQPAPADTTLCVGSALQTGSDGQARVILRPEGTVLNVSSNSRLRLKEISVNPDGKTNLRLQLDSGQIWILPRNGTQTTVKTDAATAISLGSPMGVSFQPETRTARASCLQGICSLQNEQGEIVLTASMMATFEHGELPYSYEQMSGDLLQKWVNENTDLRDYYGGKLPKWFPAPD